VDQEKDYVLKPWSEIVKGKDKVLPLHKMKAYGKSGGRAPLIRNMDI